MRVNTIYSSARSYDNRRQNTNVSTERGRENEDEDEDGGRGWYNCEQGWAYKSQVGAVKR